MRILIVNISDQNGGAARAAHRLHQSLLSVNIESNMFIINKISNDFTIINYSTKINEILSKFRSLFNELIFKTYKNKSKTVFGTIFLPLSKIVKEINQINPDIVHFHWICNGMINIKDIKQINIPIVWSLHDMWPFTGGCHYDEECEAYKKTCGKCKVLGSTKPNDLSRKIYNKKKKAYSKIDNITIVGLSKWIADCAKQSSLFKDKKIINLPNPINTEIYKPFDKINSRKLWNLPLNKKLILFGAMSATSDPRKGFKELTESLKKLKSKNIEFVVFGSNAPENQPDFGFKIHYMGTLSDDVTLVTLYNAVDVMVVPSLQENLSNAIMESLSCGTPVVGFDIGGNSDMIEHKQTGYLAKPYNTTNLAEGIDWIIKNKNYNQLCENSRKKVLKEFDSKVVAEKYIELYKEIIKK